MRDAQSSSFFCPSRRKECVLGPIFFTIYVNDIMTLTNSTILKYADDVRIYHCFKLDELNQFQNSPLFQCDINALAA